MRWRAGRARVEDTRGMRSRAWWGGMRCGLMWWWMMTETSRVGESPWVVTGHKGKGDESWVSNILKCYSSLAKCDVQFMLENVNFENNNANVRIQGMLWVKETFLRRSSISPCNLPKQLPLEFGKLGTVGIENVVIRREIDKIIPRILRIRVTKPLGEKFEISTRAIATRAFPRKQ